MKFIVYSTCFDSEKSIDKLIDRYPYLKSIGLKKEAIERKYKKVGPIKETVLTIELESIEQLMDLQDSADYELVIGFEKERGYKMPFIEIYDGYRE